MDVIEDDAVEGLFGPNEPNLIELYLRVLADITTSLQCGSLKRLRSCEELSMRKRSQEDGAL